MPDNADTFESDPGYKTFIERIHYSVCAIGDTSYDEFCKAGTDWDDKFSELGASSIQEIQLCDVDFEPAWEVWVTAVLPRIAWQIHQVFPRRVARSNDCLWLRR